MKIRMTIVAVLLLILTGLGIYSSAYYLDEEVMVNVAKSSHCNIKIPPEGPGGNTWNPPGDKIIPPGTDNTKIVKVQCLEQECYVRVYYEFSDSRVADAVTVDFNTTDWEKRGDYWYYKRILKKGETTPPLATNIHFNKEVENNFEVIVYAEAVHVKEATDYKTAFDKLNDKKVP